MAEKKAKATGKTNDEDQVLSRTTDLDNEPQGGADQDDADQGGEDQGDDPDLNGMDLAEIPDDARGRTSAEAKRLLVYACNLFGVNPSVNAKPRELMNWRWVSGEGEAPDAVVLVTGGGLKLKCFEDPDWPMDRETEDRIRKAMNLFRVNKEKTEVVPLPLPADLTLPRHCVDGMAPGQKRDHVYKRGYVKSGGRIEAARREAARKAAANK